MLEVDIASKSASLVIVPHYSPKTGEEHAVKGGDVVCLLHKEHDSYIAAEGVFTENVIVEEVHLRERYIGSKNRSKTSATNANCFFQIEIDGHSISGDKIMWEQSVRLKHLTTRKYLVLQRGDFHLTLTRDKDNEDAAFCFKNVLRAKYFIDFENFAVIEQVSTRKCLSGSGKSPIFFRGSPFSPSDHLRSP